MITLLNLHADPAAAAEPAAEATAANATRQAAHSAVLRDRDRLQWRVDQLDAKVEELKDLHRYELAIRCDIRGCRAVCSVSSSEPPAEKLLARSLIMASVSLRWRLGPETAEQLRALSGGTNAMTSGQRDLCPTHGDEPK